MLTMPGHSGYRALLLVLTTLLSACTARPVLHEFPPPLAPDARPEAAVRYTLRMREDDPDEWVLRGAQGDALGDFRWKRSYRQAHTDNQAPDRSEDFRRDDIFQDGINHVDYIFRVSATSDRLKRSVRWGTAPPNVIIFNAASGERIGELELRIGFDSRFEGDWRGRRILWRSEMVPGGEIERATDAGTVADTYPVAQLLQWTGGSNAGLAVYSGREVSEEPPEFGEPVFDVQAGRALTRRELGDAIVLLFAIRAILEAEVLVNVAENSDE